MMKASRILPLAAHGALLLAGSLSAQVRGALDVGAGTYRPDRAIPGGIASIAPTLYFDGGHFRLGASGIYSDAPAGRWNFQGSTMVQVHTRSRGPFDLEARGQVDFTRHFSARGATVVSGELRAHFRPFSGASLWAGRAFGSAATLGRRRPLQRNLVGTSARVGGIEVGLSLTNTTFDLMAGPSRFASGDSLASNPVFPETGGGPARRRLSLTDALVSTRWRLEEVDVDLTLGRRFGGSTTEITIWGVSAARSLTPTLSLVAAAGRAGSDPVTAVPGARYLVAGLRLKVGPTTATSLGAVPATTDNAPFRIGPMLAAGREVTIRAPGASRVELAGDFTDWRPVELRPSGDGGWHVVLPIAPGLHRLAVRIDRGEWQAPPGSRPIANEFGGEVTEIVVE